MIRSRCVLLVVAVVLTAASWAWADGAAPPATAPAEGSVDGGAKPVDDVEDVDQVETVGDVDVIGGGSASAAQAGTSGPTFVQVLGRLHPLAVHLPIGWLLALVLFDLAGLVFGRRGFERTGLWMLVLTVSAAVPAVVSGLLRAAELQARGAESGPIADHRNLMLTVTGLCVVALGVRLARRNVLARGWRWAYLGLILLATGLMAWGGHLGGELVYGQGYLPF